MTIQIIGDPDNQRPDKWSPTVYDLLKSTYLFGFSSSYDIQCITTFRNPILLPSSGEEKYVIW